MANDYYAEIEQLLQKENLITKNGTLNNQELTINIGDPDSFMIVSFENNQRFDRKHFITSYRSNEDGFDNFEENGNIGQSNEERMSAKNSEKILQQQKLELKKQKLAEKENARKIYSTIPRDARLDGPQVREIENIKNLLKKYPNTTLNENQKNLLQRYERYIKHVNQHYKNHTDLTRNEL